MTWDPQAAPSLDNLSSTQEAVLLLFRTSGYAWLSRPDVLQQLEGYDPMNVDFALGLLTGMGAIRMHPESLEYLWRLA